MLYFLFHLVKLKNEEAVMFLDLQCTGFSEFLVRSFGAFAQLHGTWSSRLPNLYVSSLAHGFLCKRSGNCISCSWFFMETSLEDLSSILIM